MSDIPLFTWRHHPDAAARHGPVKVADQLPRESVNSRIALWITLKIGTMPCAYLFAVIALVSLPAAVLSRNTIVIVSWIAQTFFQLVLLPVIIVGQNIQARAADARSELQYKDVGVLLHGVAQLEAHLQAQDAATAAGRQGDMA